MAAKKKTAARKKKLAGVPAAWLDKARTQLDAEITRNKELRAKIDDLNEIVNRATHNGAIALNHFILCEQRLKAAERVIDSVGRVFLLSRQDENQRSADIYKLGLAVGDYRKVDQECREREEKLGLSRRDGDGESPVKKGDQFELEP